MIDGSEPVGKFRNNPSSIVPLRHVADIIFPDNFPFEFEVITISPSFLTT